MSARGWSARFATVAATAVLIVSGAASADADSLRATYEVSLFGLPNGIASVKAKLTPYSYAMDVS